MSAFTALHREREDRRPHRSAIAALTVAVLAVGGLVLSWLGGDGDPSERRRETTTATVTVTRRTLVERESVSGTLGYSRARTVVHRVASSASGEGSGSGSSRDAPGDERGSGGDEGGAGPGASSTLTGAARPGSVVRRGEALYWVDSEPVLLMYGSSPAYRTLEEGVAAGPDVRQLEDNLAALGYDPGTVDDEFSTATAAAVRAWQDALGLDETGRVELGRVVFLAGQRRVGAHAVTVGQPLTDGQEVLESTSTHRVVKVELDVAKQALVRTGDDVRVTLPSGRTVRGRIANVGRAAHAKSGDEGGSGMGEGDSGAEELVIDVTIVLRSARRIRSFDQAPVTVDIASERRRRALVVPVNALLAMRGGGYGVELAGSRRIVRVKTGLFADGLVEILGGRLRAGARVVVPE